MPKLYGVSNLAISILLKQTGKIHLAMLFAQRRPNFFRFNVSWSISVLQSVHPIPEKDKK
jgi:hypothetical protein